jgi:hypothetical protein
MTCEEMFTHCRYLMVLQYDRKVSVHKTGTSTFKERSEAMKAKNASLNLLISLLI